MRQTNKLRTEREGAQTIRDTQLGLGAGRRPKRKVDARGKACARAASWFNRIGPAKRELPYLIFGGEFTQRNSGSLICHSGVYAIDLDKLARREATQMIQRALADPYCLAAIETVRFGVRLLFRTPPLSADLTERVSLTLFNIRRVRSDFEIVIRSASAIFLPHDICHPDVIPE